MPRVGVRFLRRSSQLEVLGSAVSSPREAYGTPVASKHCLAFYRRQMAFPGVSEGVSAACWTAYFYNISGEGKRWGLNL